MKIYWSPGIEYLPPKFWPKISFVKVLPAIIISILLDTLATTKYGYGIGSLVGTLSLVVMALIWLGPRLMGFLPLGDNITVSSENILITGPKNFKKKIEKASVVRFTLNAKTLSLTTKTGADLETYNIRDLKNETDKLIQQIKKFGYKFMEF